MAMTMMMSENQSSQSHVHVKLFRGTEDLAVKSQFKKAIRCLYVQGEAQFLPNTSHVIGNGRSTRHSRQVIRSIRPTATDFIFYSRFGVHNILQYCFRTGEDNKRQD